MLVSTHTSQPSFHVPPQAVPLALAQTPAPRVLRIASLRASVSAVNNSFDVPVTRLDRRETELNEAIPGDPRDTTTPAAMLDDMRRLLLGDALSPASRRQLGDWLLANTTGGSRLRAGLPGDWRVGDKTGTGDNGINNASNDIAIAWPPGRAPLLVTAYYAEAEVPQEARNAVLAEVGDIAAGLATRT